jgi:amino acid adenylation domain-containing protein/non-ribosomal peptide synthase protein (TIGR01720 family)
MSDLAKRLARLTPEQRALFELRMKQRNQRASQAQRIPRRDPTAVCLQSVDQERLWFMYQLEPGSAAYNVSFAFRLRGVLDRSLLERSFNALAQRHEILRTTYATASGQAVQQIAPTWTIEPLFADLRSYPVAERAAETERLLVGEAQRPFDLTHTPPLRITLLQLDSAEHVLMTTMHHIATDWWSFNVLHTELFQLYAAFTATPQADPEQTISATLPELPIQFADFALWQREWLQATVLQDQLAYWKTQLTEAPPLELPTDRPRPAFQTFRGARHGLSLPSELSAALTTLAQREGVTLFMLLLATFKLVLYRYTSQADLVVGSPIANRSRPEIEPLIGFFVNTLVLRTDLSGNPSFRALVQRVREVCLQAYAHQDMPFAQLVHELQIERDPSRSPLVQVGFLIVGQAPVPATTALAIESLEFDPGISMFELSLALRDQADGLSGFFEYNTDLFDAATIERLAGHWRIVLEQVVAAPDQRIATLPLLSEPELQQVVYAWNATAAPYPADQTLNDLFAAQVARTPDAVAISDGTHSLTFAELDRRSNRLAWHLRSLGVHGEVPVGLCVPRSVDAIVALLAVLKAGGAYVPLDPAYPTARLRFMADDAAVALMLTCSTVQGRIAGTSAPVLCLDTLAATLEQYPTTPPPVALTPDHLLYVVYTSGSTGQPKGVLGLQRGVLNRLQWMWTTYPFAPGERCCQKTALSFVDSVWEIFGPLLRGIPVHVIADDLVKDPVQLVRVLAEQRISRIVLVPGLLRAMLDTHPALANHLPDLKLWVASGEALPLDLAQRFVAQMTHATLLNLYGSSEVAADATWHELRGPVDAVLIGRPLANMTAYVLDNQMQPVPIGVPGEIWIGGVGLARGYLNRPELTAEKFVPDLFSGGVPGARLYRTGDRGRWLADGRLDFLGRIDRQVKLRGFRIELGEIEHALLAQPAVQAAVAEIRETRAGHPQLVAYVVENKEQRNRVPMPEGRPRFCSPQDLRAFLGERLPDYMVPSAFVWLDALPLTPNGKVDRAALPEPVPTGGVAWTAPGTELEATVARIWAEVLGLDQGQVGIHDNFFALGGHSLLATQVISRLRAALAVELPLRALFAAPTVAALAARVEAMQSHADPDPAAFPAIPHADRSASLPLSFAQQRLWFLDQLQPGVPGYNIATAVRVRGTLDPQALQHSLNAVVARHEALRTTFTQHDGRAYQIIAPSLTIELPLIDLRPLPHADRAAEAERVLAAAARQSFDLRHGPLLRARLVQLEADCHMLLLVMHHIISDGWSLGVVVRELTTLYRAATDRQMALTLPDLPVQYADFACWQRQAAYEALLERQLAYWRTHLAGAPMLLDLPTDHPCPAVQTLHGAQHGFTLSASLRAALEQLSATEGTTLFMTLLAAFNVLLYRYSGQADLLVGSPIANRRRPELEPLIGFFVNTLVLRSDLTGKPTFRAVMQRVRQVALAAYEHQDVPFERLVEALQPPRDLSRPPLVQVMFVLQNTPVPSLSLPGLSLEPISIATATSRFDLTLELAPTERGLAGTFEYNTDLFDAATIARWAEHWRVLLEAIVTAPDQLIATLPLLPDTEMQQVVYVWNATAAPYSADSCFPVLFSEQAMCAPDAPALVDADRQLTYAELERRSNQLAWHLRTLGVGTRDVRVGVCLPRTGALVVALLGIFKAGGVYVPLDPAYPQARLDFILRDAAVAVVLADATTQDRLGNVPVLQIDSFDAMSTQYPTTPPPIMTTPDHLAYIIYTSGSTGQPKGVMVTHRGLTNLVQSEISTLGLQSGSRVLQWASISFDAAIWEICAALAAGAALYLVPEAARMPGPPLHTTLQQHAISVATLPPSALAVTSAADLPALQTIIAAGEACSAAIVTTWAQGRQFINGYGPTESTVCATWGVCVPDGSAPSIGRPLTNIAVYVLDNQMQPVPIGVPGELWIGGVGLARGYLNRPELTAEKFMPDPFSSGVPGARLYRSGDRGRWRPDGRLDFLGRIDRQVKLRGFRIELGEIEHTLLAQPAVQAAVAEIRETRAGHPQLVAYVVGTERSTESAADELRTWLQSRLPAYMVPSAFVWLDALPLTPNGKVDHNALPEPDRLPVNAALAMPPRTEVEMTLVRIWAEVLGLDQEQVGIHDNFFALGGDSILSIQIVARAHQAGLQITPSVLFQHQTIAELSPTVAFTAVAEAPPEITTGVVPLTPIQRWFFEQSPACPQHFNQSLLLEARRPLDFNLLEQAIQQLPQRHDALRLRFVHDAQGWRQLYSDTIPPVPCAYVDLSSLPAAEQRAMVEQTAAETQTGLDLQDGPLMRVVLFEHGPAQSQRLLLVIHHLVIDGVSWRILLDDLQTAYSLLAQQHSVNLAAGTTTFARWAEQLRAYAQTDALKAELSYWLKHADRPQPTLPLDAPAGTNTVATTRTITLSLDAEETRALLHDVPPVYHTQINDVLLTALAQGFNAWTGQRSLLLDLEGHGREDLVSGIDLSRTVGWFTSLFPVTLELPQGPEPGVALKAVKEQLRQIPRRGIGYGLLRYLRDDPESAARLQALPAPQINFNYLGQTDQVVASLFGIAPESSGPNVDPGMQRRYLLEISGIVSGGQLQMQWNYSEAIHHRATIEVFAQHCMAALRALIRHCLAADAGGLTPSDVPAAKVNQAELDKLLGMIGHKGGRRPR